MPFRKVPNYIVKTRASYQLQRGVPSDIQAKVGKKKWKEGGGKTLNEARARVPGFIACTDVEIRQARGERLTPEERLIETVAVAGLKHGDLVEMAAPTDGQYPDDGTPNPEYESLMALAEVVQQGKANTLLSTEGLLQVRRLDREPASRTFAEWVKALKGFMAFTEHSKRFQCNRANAVAYKDHLLGRISRSSVKTQLAYLAGLWTMLIEKQGTGEHIFKGLPGTLDETTRTKALRGSTGQKESEL